MFRPLVRSHHRPTRPGSTLLVVVFALALMAALGVAYGLFAKQQLGMSTVQKTGAGSGGAPPRTAPDPTNTVNRFFGALIYDAPYDDYTNALRGHSIARSMYGYDGYLFLPAVNQPPTTAYNGVGTFREPNQYGDRAQQVNYTVMTIGGTTFLLDPEYMGVRPLDAAGAPVAFDPTARPHVSKAAGYTYPDLKDYWLGAVSPSTGEVTTPSFHREWLFGPLDPSNPKWYSPTGRLSTLRPLPLDHPRFPRVPLNADGVTYTGDVQNLPGGARYDAATGRYYSINDSLWMNLNLPTQRIGDKTVQPLVAALILPLDGLLDANSHGNNYDPTTGAHVGFAAQGPHEVNIGKVITNELERQQIINARGPRQRRNGITTHSFDPYLPPGALNPVPLSNYGQVAWNASAPASITYPTGASLTGLPTYQNHQATNAAEPNHPALFNPTEWPSTTQFSNRIFPLGDIKRFHRYAFSPDWYFQSTLGPLAPTDLRGTYGYTVANGQVTASNYRLDPAHPNRMLFRTRSFALDRPALAPMFQQILSGTSNVGQTASFEHSYRAGVYPAPGPRGALTDFAADNRWVNQYAALGAVDVNRPLADYRADPNLPLSATNVSAASAAQAASDRQQLARDIFARMIVATGAPAYVDPTTGAITLPQPAGAGAYTLAANGQTLNLTTQDYEVLRYLAQLSVNMVAMVDRDNVMDEFVWNPLNPADPRNPANFATELEIRQRVVYGVENPQLLLNEVHGEIVNDPMDPVNGVPDPTTGVQAPPAGPAHVRFWLELLHHGAAPGGILEPGVPLSAYRIEISRRVRVNPTTMAVEDLIGNFHQDVDGFNDNVTGGFNPTYQPDIVYPLNAGNTAATVVQPNAGVYNPAGAPGAGMVLLGPPVTPKAGSQEFTPPAAAPWTNLIASPAAAPAPAANSLAYTRPLPAQGEMMSDAVRQHTILLRRLANPYLPPQPVPGAAGYNPYITVDVVDRYRARDALHRASMQGTDRAVAMNNGGFEPAATRFSVGKVQPLASVVEAAPAVDTDPAYTFPGSMVVRQTTAPAAPPPAPAQNPNEPRHTFGRHNGATAIAPVASTLVPGSPTTGVPPSLAGGETILAPFDWLPHFDRPLTSKLELREVVRVKPHLLTTKFAAGWRGGATQPLSHAQLYDQAWDVRNPGTATLHRSLELITVRSRVAGVANGGRVPGLIDLNAVNDIRIHRAMLDRQPGNLFDDAYVDDLWTNWMNSRSTLQAKTTAGGVSYQVPVPTRSRHDDITLPIGGADRPFLPFGAPTTANAGGSFAYSFASAGDTPLRHLVDGERGGVPRVFLDGSPQAATGQPLPHSFLAEPGRKLVNHATTRSQTFVVFLTIGYFDVVGSVQLAPGVTIPQLGPEAYMEIPGDTRQKFVAVIDMSNMALKPLPASPTDTDWHATGQPFFTSLESTTYATGTASATINVAHTRPDPVGNSLYVAADGQEIPITIGSTLVLGYGVEQQIVTVQGVGPTAGQLSVTTVTGAPFRTAWGGTSVSNVRPGYPGPQPGFSYSDAKYKPVIPYVERLK